MQKNKTKLIFTLFIITILFLTTFCLAVETNETTLISEINEEQSSLQNSTNYSDLYVSQDGEYNINNIIDGSVFASVETLNIDPSNNGGIITGNLYVSADTVNIKSNFKYSETEKDELGNQKLESVTNSSTIYGNVYVIADKFVLEPKCEINGDLYICANEIELCQNSIIRGNVFVIGNTINFNSEINGGDLYAKVKNFNMKYYGFIYRDLHITSENVTLEGYVYRSSFIDAKNITTTSTFINNKNFNVENALNMNFSGEIKGNANINSKNITFKSKDDTEKNITCLISGDLNYSSKNEIQIEDKIVSGNVNYSEYKTSSRLLSSVGTYLLELLTSLIFVIIIYLSLNRFAPKFIEKLSNLNASGILKYLGIGILVLVALPVLSILLLITNIGSLLGLLLAIVYALLLIVAKPIVVIVISKMINKKVKSINTYVGIGIITILLSLINLIPYIEFVVSLLVNLTGLGMMVKSLLPSKK